MKCSLTRINSANDETSGVWVAIEYVAEDRRRHALFIVGGERTDVPPTRGSPFPIYFERDDQSLSCYEGVDRIFVGKNSIRLTLNKNGRNSLELPKMVEFHTEKPGRPYAKAKLVFREIKSRKSGEVITIV